MSKNNKLKGKSDAKVFTKYSQVDIALLRTSHPGWKWAARRVGFGWEYVGVCDAVTVTVYPVARLVNEDEFFAEWRVRHDGAFSEPYDTFFLREGII